MTERLRAAALAEFARQLGPQHHASAMCHLAETLMMLAKSRSSIEYVRCWPRKIEAHLDGDAARVVATIMRADGFAPKIHWRNVAAFQTSRIMNQAGKPCH